MTSTITPADITPADIIPNSPKLTDHISIKPGDVIVFSGVDIVSRLIQFVTRSPYSHVAIVISVDKCKIQIAESTLSGLDSKLQKIVGPIAVLSNRITGASSIREKLFVLPLKNALTTEQQLKLLSYVEGSHTKKYDYRQAIRAGFDIFDRIIGETKPCSTEFFCSEFVVSSLQHLGIISETINSAEQAPKDIILLDCFEELIPLN